MAHPANILPSSVVDGYRHTFWNLPEPSGVLCTRFQIFYSSPPGCTALNLVSHQSTTGRQEKARGLSHLIFGNVKPHAVFQGEPLARKPTCRLKKGAEEGIRSVSTVILFTQLAFPMFCVPLKRGGNGQPPVPLLKNVIKGRLCCGYESITHLGADLRRFALTWATPGFERFLGENRSIRSNQIPLAKLTKTNLQQHKKG